MEVTPTHMAQVPLDQVISGQAPSIDWQRSTAKNSHEYIGRVNGGLVWSYRHSLAIYALTKYKPNIIGAIGYRSLVSQGVPRCRHPEFLCEPKNEVANVWRWSRW